MFIKFSFVSQKLQFLCLRVSSIALAHDNDNQVVFSFWLRQEPKVSRCLWVCVRPCDILQSFYKEGAQDRAQERAQESAQESAQFYNS